MDERKATQPSPELPISGEKLGMIVSAMESSPLVIYDSLPGQQVLEGDIEGLGFRVKMPHLRKGKHASVGIVDINDVDGRVFSFILRNKLGDSLKYQEVVRNHPGIKNLLPRQYDTVGDWAVLERLYGLEQREIIERMEVDPDFVVKYADEAWGVLQTVLGEGLETQDVRFSIGQNIMADPKSANIRLVEQANVSRPPEGYSRDEILTRMLTSELIGAEEYSDSQLQFIISLFGKALETIDPNQLFVRGREIKKGHPEFDDIWQAYNGGKMIIKSEGSNKPWYLENISTEQPETLGYWEQGVTKSFSPEFWNAVRTNSVQGLREALINGGSRFEITDPNDLRCHPIILA